MSLPKKLFKNERRDSALETGFIELCELIVSPLTLMVSYRESMSQTDRNRTRITLIFADIRGFKNLFYYFDVSERLPNIEGSAG